MKILKTQFPSTVTAVAPGKLILSGEHAVVYGKPALAMAINRFCEVTVQPLVSEDVSTERYIVFDFQDLNCQRTFTVAELLALRRQYANKKNVNIKNNPVLLAVYAFVEFAVYLSREVQKTKNQFWHNLALKIDITSTIPMNCGFGSSAAMIVALGFALEGYFARQISPDVFLLLAKEIENLQHRRSSGLDLYLSYYGGMVWFSKDEITPREITPTTFLPLIFVNTGKSESITAECVEYASKYLMDKQRNILEDFERVTKILEQALQQGDEQMVLNCIRENNKLLIQIGVVPLKVQNFIAEIEKRGMAAKISGAGAVKGEKAGVVLVWSERGKNQIGIDDLVLEYGYEVMPINVERDGVR